jgi:hypothetical protein
MSGEVGSGQIAIYPVFKGFRKKVAQEVDGTAAQSAKRFQSGFRGTGEKSGKQTGTGFRKAFSAATNGVSTGLVKQITADVASASRAVSAARMKELDAAGKLRLAETQLGEARSKYSSNSSQVVRAEERLASAQRTLAGVEETTRDASDRLTAAKQRLAAASEQAAAASTRAGSGIRGAFSGLVDLVSRVGSQVSRTLGLAGSGGSRSFVSGFGGGLATSFFGNLLSDITQRIASAIRDGIRIGFDYINGSVQLASDLSETTSAVKQVFGDASVGILDFTKTANKALGQTRQQALLGAQTFGVFGQSAGLQKKKLSDFSTGLVGLSADLASFYNASPQDVTEALSAGLRGEAEPLRRYGILLDDATLKQQARTLGIYKGNAALSQQQRILAAHAVIFEQSSIAQGDFARTSGGLANQQRILDAQLQDTQARLGQKLLPVFTKFATFANSNLLPVLERIIDQVGPVLAAGLEESAPAIENLLTELAPLMPELARLAVSGLPPLINLLTALVPLLIDWTKNARANIDTFQGLFDLLAGNTSLQEFLETMRNTTGSTADAAHAFGTWLIPGIRAVTGAANSAVSQVRSFVDLVGSVPVRLASLASEAKRSGGALIQGFIDGIKSKVKPVTDVVESLMARVAGFFPHSPAKYGPFSGSGWSAIKAAGSAIEAQFQAGFSGKVAPLTAALEASGQGTDGSESSSSESDRPILMDGRIIAWLRKIANGEAQIVWAMNDAAVDAVIRGGTIR